MELRANLRALNQLQVASLDGDYNNLTTKDQLFLHRRESNNGTSTGQQFLG
jgi:hypothetical protein